VVRSAAAEHGIFLERAKRGRGFSRIENIHIGVVGFINVLARHRGDTGHALDEIKRCSLRHQNTARGTGDRKRNIARTQGRAVLNLCHNTETSIHFLKNRFGNRPASQNTVGTCNQIGRALPILQHERKGGHIQLFRTKVFSQCFADT